MRDGAQAPGTTERSAYHRPAALGATVTNREQKPRKRSTGKRLLYGHSHPLARRSCEAFPRFVAAWRRCVDPKGASGFPHPSSLKGGIPTPPTLRFRSAAKRAASVSPFAAMADHEDHYLLSIVTVECD